MQCPQPTNEAPTVQQTPTVDGGPSQPHFKSAPPHPHTNPLYPHPHPPTHFDHPHWASTSPFSRFWSWSGSYAVPPPPAPPTGPALHSYPHPHPHLPPPSIHQHAHIRRRSCRPHGRLFLPVLVAVGGIVAYKRLQRDIEDVRSEAVDKEGRPLMSRREKRWEEWRERQGGWREREEETRRKRKEGEDVWAERWRAAVGQQQQQSPVVQTTQQQQQTEHEKWV